MSCLSAINLVLLGLLMEKPLSAYDLDKLVGQGNFRDLVKISTPAIYKNLIKLNENNYLASHTVKEGDMPEKTIYEVTEKGRQFFLELMYQFAAEKVKINFDFNALVLNLNKVDRERGLRMLENIRNNFFYQQKKLDEQMMAQCFAPLSARTIIRQFQLVNEALIRWVEELIIQYKNEK